MNESGVERMRGNGDKMREGVKETTGDTNHFIYASTSLVDVDVDVSPMAVDVTLTDMDANPVDRDVRDGDAYKRIEASSPFPG